MKFSPDDVKKVLVDAGIIKPEQFDDFVKSAGSENKDIQEYILDAGVIKEDQLGQLLAKHIDLPFTSLSQLQIPEEVLRIIPEFFARKQKIIIFKVDEKGTHVATNDPLNYLAVDFIRKKVGKNVLLYYTTLKSIKDALAYYAKDATKAFEEILAQNIKQAKGSFGKSKELPIIKMVETLIEYAYANKASDIHIEPEEKYSLLRFRIDGLLHDIIRLPKEIHDQVVTRIKVLSNLRTDEHHAPQDGKIEYRIEADEGLSLRVSIVPVIHGEKVVLRLLADQSKRLSLGDLGFFDQSLDKIIRAYKKPYGMILTTGPTGSGKTTTLYAILKILNRREVNITTIEDPVEYSIENVNQIQINQKTNLTFASGLRSIVRQDPNVILVGEIRDQETAKIAVNSAMTGHLVLSTLHTNDAATTIPRLFDMGIEPFLVASSVNVIVGQRLVRKICEHCRTSVDINQKGLEEYKKSLSSEIIKKHFGGKGSHRVYFGKGCDICHGTGYIGRIGVYEVMEVDDEIRKAIVAREDSDQIATIAVKNGMLTMVDDGIQKVKMGITTLEEIIRVTKE